MLLISLLEPPAQKHEEEIMAELDPDAVFGRRRIEGHGDSFTISVSNTTHSSAGEKESEVLGNVWIFGFSK